MRTFPSILSGASRRRTHADAPGVGGRAGRFVRLTPLFIFCLPAMLAMPLSPAVAAPSSPKRPAAALRDYVVDLPVSVDERTVGELSVILRGTVLHAVDAASWRALGPRHFSPETVETIASKAVDGRIPTDAFSEGNLPIRYDPARLLLVLSPLGDQRAIIPLSIQQRLGNNLPGVDVGGGRFGAYMNVRAIRDYVSGGTGSASNGPTKYFLDGAARLFGPRGVAVEWSAFYDGQRSSKWTRGDTRVIHDDVEQAIRYAAGDVYFQTAQFQGAIPLFGVSSERRFSVLQPTRVITSTGEQSFLLNRPSRVNVFINGVFQRTFQLEPGRYSLRDFAAAEGANEVRIEVEDSAGQREVIQFSLFGDATLLQAGLSEFSFNGGFRRKADTSSTINYDFDRPAWSSYFRYGVTDAVTVGGNYQGEPGLNVLGMEGVTATVLGNFSGALNHSRRDGAGAGWAATGRWFTNIGSGPMRRLQRLDLSTIYTGRDYAPLGVEQPTNRFSTQTQARLTTPLAYELMGSLSARHARARDENTKDENRITLMLTRRFGFVSASFSTERLTGNTNEVRSFLTLSVPLGRQQGATASWQSQDNRSRLDWWQAPTQAVNDLSGSLAVETSDFGRSETADLTYRANRFIARGRHDITHALTGGTTERSRLQFETGVAFVDGYGAIGRPISDGYAVVSRHPSLKDSDVLVNPTSDGPMAVADGWGPALVPGLGSYRPQQVTWDVRPLPSGYDLGNTRRLVIPALRAGVHYQVGSAASFTAVGVALRPDGTPLSLVAGELRASDGRDFRPGKLFTNRSGRFVAQSLAPGAYTVTFATSPPSFLSFRVADDASNFINLGNLQLQEK